MPGGADADTLGLPPELALDSLALAIEGTATGAWIWEIDADRIHWTPNLGPLHGLERGEAPVSFAAWLEQVHPDDRERIQGLIAQALESGTGFEFEFRAASAEPARWLHARAQIQRGDDGRARAVVGVTLDVTARRRREAERDRLYERLRGVLTVMDVTLAHLELDALLEELLARVSQVLAADIAKVLFFDEQRTELLVGKAHGLPDEAVAGLRVPAGSGVAGRVAAGGRPVILSGEATQDAVLDHLRDPHRSTAGVPLRVDHEVLGVLTVSTRVRDYDAHDLVLLELVADRVARAIRQSELYEAAREAALSLQRSLLPAALPTVPGLEAAARYRAGQDGTEVGGDWYDVLELPGERIGIIVGDCVGRGLPAAAVMGQLRSSARALLLTGAEPAVLLDELDSVAALIPDAYCTTVFLAIFDPRSGMVRYSNAGHLPAILVSAESPPGMLDDAVSVPLGVLRSAPRPQATRMLPGGSTLMLYTDGLVERRDKSIDAGIERLTKVLADSSHEPVEAAAQRVLGEMSPPDGYDDDVAIVVFRRAPDPLHIELPATVDRLREVRSRLIVWLAAAGAGDDLIADILRAVNEASTNSVEHAYRHVPAGIMRVHAEVVGNEIEVAVTDFGAWKPPDSDPTMRGRGLPMMRALSEHVHLENTPGGTTVEMTFALPVAHSAAGGS